MQPVVTFVLASTAVSAATSFLLLARQVKARELKTPDRDARRVVQSARTTAGDAAAELASPLGKESLHVPVALALSALFWRRGIGAAAALPLLASVSSAAASSLFDHSAAIQLPPPGHPDRDKPCFPSGHAFETSALGLTAAYVATREGIAPAAAVFGSAAALSFATTAGRVYLDRHWVTDAIGGWLLGIATAATFALAYEAIRPSADQPPARQEAPIA